MSSTEVCPRRLALFPDHVEEDLDRLQRKELWDLHGSARRAAFFARTRMCSEHGRRKTNK